MPKNKGKTAKKAKTPRRAKAKRNLVPMRGYILAEAFRSVGRAMSR